MTKTTTRYGILGTSTTIALGALLFWQLFPKTSAHDVRKTSPQGSEKSVPKSVVSDNTDEILLNSQTLNVKSIEREKNAVAIETADGNGLHLIRFSGPIKGAWVDSLKRERLTVVDYIPHYTYLVWGDSLAIQRVREMAKNGASQVEWVGPYKPEYRIMPNVFLNTKSTRSNLRSDRFEVQLFKNDFANAQTFKVIDSLRTTDIVGRQEVKHYVNFVVGLDAEGLRQVSELPDVISIYPYIEPQKYDERQNFILRAGGNPTPGDWLAYLASKGLTQASFDASNFVVDVSDSGIGNGDAANENQFLLRRMGDPNLASRVAYSRLEGTPNGPGSTLAGCDGHGNLNSTIIAGYVPTGGIFGSAPHADAMGYRYGMGIAPFVKVGSSVIFDPDDFTNPNLPNLQARAYNDGARITSNSWGSPVGGAYTSTSQTFDVLVRDAQLASSVFPTVGNQEMVVVFSSGNSGPGQQTIGAPGTAKNLITVGASENVQAFGGADFCGVADSGADSANDIISFSSRGPTTDGRKKPDIMLPGTHVTGGAAQNVASNPVTGTGTQLLCFDGSGVCAGVGSNFFPTGQQWYTASSGTSHSAPAVSGYAALIRQHFINTAPLNGGVGAGTPPSPAMTKALMMNTASYMNGVGANDNLFSNNQGMGLADLDNYFDVFAQAHILSDQKASETFTDTGQERIYTGVVADSAKPFRVTIAYSDAPGSTTGNAFVNDLDLEVTVGGNTYKGNVFAGGTSALGGSADTRNNVESVFIPAGVSGNFLVRVKATNIAGDGLPGNADVTDQDFALVVWNGGESIVPVIGGGATALTAESCAINGAIDPAETVTINFDLSNIGLASTTDLVATLLPTGGISSPSGPQNYGALTAGGGPVTRSFTFTATTNCGESLVASLQLQDGATNLGVATFSFLTGALASPSATTISSGSLSAPIPDLGTVNIPVQVTTTGVLSDLNVKVRLNHTFDRDLEISITSPSGTTVPLSSRRGGGGADYGSGSNDCSGTFTVFDDGAATPISSGTAPFAGSFRPESQLSAFNGQSISGTWTLTFSDLQGEDVGTVGCVQLEMQRQRYVCCGVPGTPELASGGTPSLVNESFVPQNGTPDPGETVTYNISIVNGGDGPTNNLVATLQNSGGITPITTSRVYGALQPAAGATSQQFTFVTNGSCGSMVTATFQLQDGATNYGTIAYTFQLGVKSVTNQEFTNPAAISIPAVGVAGLYPSVINVTGAPTTITRVVVTLNGVSHTWPGDVDVLLVSPTGRKFILLSDAGNSASSGISSQTLVFDDSGSAILPDIWTTLPTGPYKPTNYGTGDTFASPAPTTPYLSPGTAGTDTFASAFGGVTGGDPNGNWSLYVADDASPDSGSISGGWKLTLVSETLVCSTTPGAPTRAVRADFDADGKTDLSIYRPSTGTWWLKRSTAGIGSIQWGSSGDIPLSGDFWGDKQADFGIYRGNVSQADFWLLNTNGSSFDSIRWGLPGDVPFSGDYNGDGIVDIALYRQSEGIFYVFTRGASGVGLVFPFGLPGDIPLAGNFTSDNKTDLVVYRPSTGTWYIASAEGTPADNAIILNFGLVGDIPVPADYDNDGRDDIAVYRPSTGEWFSFLSGSFTAGYARWGLSTDIPVPGDYDGDGKYDVAIYRNGEWWIYGSTAGPMVGFWGLAGDIPIPATYIDPIP